MRPIDADALIESMTKFSNATGEDMTHGIFYAHIEPTIDAVPVIRCAECYFWDKEPSQTAMPEVHTCRFWRIGTICVDYCARASRDGWLKAMSDDRKDIDEEIERAWEYAETD